MILGKLKTKNEKYDLNEIVKLRYFYNSCSELEILKNQYILKKSKNSKISKATMTELSIVIAVLAIIMASLKEETDFKYYFMIFLTIFLVIMILIFIYCLYMQSEDKKLKTSIMNIDYIIKHKGEFNLNDNNN